MQTIYYTTQNYIRHTGNVVDLTQYRERLGLAQEETPAGPPAAVEDGPRRAPRRRRRQHGIGLTLDLCATLAVVIMAITVMAKWIALT